MRANVGVSVSVRGSRRSKLTFSGIIVGLVWLTVWLGWWLGKLTVRGIFWIVDKIEEMRSDIKI